ncbi:hypothetical protein TNCV_4661581 [Trichonephila clavipes]|uniref:Uncharacterized protein n=1 Tax=Trichonephila clavipes TaxID=2585209 RepID=A0A8X6SGV2_TRICX|nr:hypothetical protein TNCV_4661581 [Trichonephila clavipes]
MISGDGPRNFGPQSSAEDDILAGSPLSKLPYHTNVKTLNLDIFNVNRPLYVVHLQRHKDSTTPTLRFRP